MIAKLNIAKMGLLFKDKLLIRVDIFFNFSLCQKLFIFTSRKII